MHGKPAPMPVDPAIKPDGDGNYRLVTPGERAKYEKPQDYRWYHSFTESWKQNKKPSTGAWNPHLVYTVPASFRFEEQAPEPLPLPLPTPTPLPVAPMDLEQMLGRLFRRGPHTPAPAPTHPHTTPLHLALLLHYATRRDRTPEGSSPAGIQYTAALQNRGLITPCKEASGYRATEKGAAYVRRLLDTPLPVKSESWV